MNQPKDPYAVLKAVFAARFGGEIQNTFGQPSPAQAQQSDPAHMGEAPMPEPQAQQPDIAEELAQGAQHPPVSHQEAAALLMAALAHAQGRNNAVALG